MEQEQYEETHEEGALSGQNRDTVIEQVHDERGKKDHILIMVIAVIVVALALAYLWGSGVGNRTVIETEPDILPPMLPQEDAQVEVIVPTASDEINAIESDLLRTDIENLDAGLETLEAELQGALNE